ncbi:MAG: XamI family restriction endonuclease [Phycisphaeraceae bacterium]
MTSEAGHPWSKGTELRRLAEEAKQVYVDSLDPETSRQSWHAALDDVSHAFADQLREALQAGRLEKTIQSSGAITELLRQLTAPPLSQDQFSLICPDYSKGAEKNARPVSVDKAVVVAATFRRWLDPRIIEAFDSDHIERITQVAAGPLYILARQKFETDRRTKAAAAQEQAVIDLLESLGFERAPSRVIDQPWTVGENCYMHKTTFSAAVKSTAEVDIAIGLPGGRLLAIECKVSNDATNSIKRINDVLKKREAWERGYGQVLTTGAVLSGVIAGKDIARLAAADVCVFFSHSLQHLQAYLSRASYTN